MLAMRVLLAMPKPPSRRTPPGQLERLVLPHTVWSVPIALVIGRPAIVTITLSTRVKTLYAQGIIKQPWSV